MITIYEWEGGWPQSLIAEVALAYQMQTVQFAAKHEFLDEIREYVGRIARGGGFAEKDVYDIMLATDEAASNIIEHAYENRSDGVLELSCSVQDNTFRIILVDRGRPFDPSEIPLPELKADLFDRQIGGLGIFLLRKLMDEVHYETKADHSNTLTMIKGKSRSAHQLLR